MLLRRDVPRRSRPRPADLSPSRINQGYFTDIRIDRDEIARHGLAIEDVQDVIQYALGGQNVTWTIEGRERYPVNVRYARAFREDLPMLERVLVSTPTGAQAPLGQLADIRLTPGPAMIRDEDGQLAGYVYVDTAIADVGGYVERARAALAQQLQLAPGYTLAWTGQYEFQVRVREWLQVLIPIVLFIIFALLYLTFQSASEATIVMLSVVYAMTGGVILQWWLGYNFSVAVWVGYIALYGVAVQSGVVMVIYLHEALDRRLRQGGEVTEEDIRQATIAGSVLRLRPKVMTVSVVMAVLVPIMWSTRRRLGRHEADRRPDHRRDGDLDDSCADHHAGDFLPHEALCLAQGHPSGCGDGAVVGHVRGGLRSTAERFTTASARFRRGGSSSFDPNAGDQQKNNDPKKL